MHSKTIISMIVIIAAIGSATLITGIVSTAQAQTTTELLSGHCNCNNNRAQCESTAMRTSTSSGLTEESCGDTVLPSNQQQP